MTIQPIMLRGKLLNHIKRDGIVHGTLRLPNNSTMHLVFKETDVFIQLGQVLVMDAQPHVSVIASPFSYHKPGVGNVAIFEVLEITPQSDSQAVINQVIYITNWFSQHIPLQNEIDLLTKKTKHDTIISVTQ